MGRALFLVALAAGIVAAPTGTTAPAIVETRSCALAGGLFNLHVAGHKRAGYWFGALPDTFSPLPAGKVLALAWSFGSQTTREPVLYAWSVDTETRFRAGCRVLGGANARPPAGALRAPFRVKQGWSVGKRYECAGRGRLAIRAQTSAKGMRMTVWAERNRQLLAVAELTKGGGWMRVAKSCAERRF
jgi:hypothetical protein